MEKDDKGKEELYSSDEEKSESWHEQGEDSNDENEEIQQESEELDLGLSSVTQKNEDKPFEVLTPEMIIERQQEALLQVSSVLTSMSFSHARILLQFFRWDADKALEAYTLDSANLCDKLGIPAPEFKEPKSQQPQMERISSTYGSKITKTEGSCPICFEEASLTGLSCGHSFCSECWGDYLGREVLEKNKKITCPGNNCNLTLDDLIVFQLLGDENEERKYKESLVQSFVDDNPSVRWCPAVNCVNAIILYQISENRNESVKCLCGNIFCFRCAEEDHRPNSCKMWRKWKKKHDGGDDSLNEQLIASITRKCVKCQTNIQKNGGCNHVKCTQCGYHFCWQCMGKFGSGPKGGQDGYNNHKCNKQFEDDEHVLQKQEELKRFHFYSERFNNHSRSFQLELKLLDACNSVVQQLMEKSGLSEKETSFYREAIEQLLKNRHILKHSYAFGYFRPLEAKSVNKEIFENLQLDLEMHTEKLSHLLEDSSVKPVTQLKEGRKEIFNQTKVAKSVLTALLDAASEWNLDGDSEEDNEDKDKSSETSPTSPKKPKKEKKESFLKKIFSKKPK